MALQCVPGFVIEKDLQHALADGSGDTVLDEGLVLEGQTITSLRAGFYVVDQRRNVVSLVHCSTKSYWMTTDMFNFPKPTRK